MKKNANGNGFWKKVLLGLVAAFIAIMVFSASWSFKAISMSNYNKVDIAVNKSKIEDMHEDIKQILRLLTKDR